MFQKTHHFEVVHYHYEVQLANHMKINIIEIHAPKLENNILEMMDGSTIRKVRTNSFFFLTTPVFIINNVINIPHSWL